MKTLPVRNSKNKGYQKVGYNVYLVRYKIADIIDHSNAPGKSENKIGKKGYAPELCLELVLESEDYRYNKFLFGNYEYVKDKISGKITECKGWLLNKNQVYNFLSEFENESIKLNDDFTIQKGYLDNIIGKEIYMIKYKSNDGYKNDFWLIKAATEQGKIQLLEAFEKYLPKDYDNEIPAGSEEAPF